MLAWKAGGALAVAMALGGAAIRSQSGSPAPGAYAAPPAGTVKYVTDVGGLPEAEAVLREFAKPADWNLDPRTICLMRQDSMADALQDFERFFSPEFDAVRKTRPPFDLLQAHLGLANLLAYRGQMDRAVPHYEGGLAIARSSVPHALPVATEMLGAAYLHKAEMDNGAYRTPSDLCLIPPAPGRKHANSSDAEKAIEQFLAYLRQQPDDLEVRWLLNLAYMMVGRYPDGVPSAYVIPPARFGSADGVPRFRDVAVETGLNVFATAGGVIVDDFGSGRLDVLTSNFYSCDALHYFSGNGDGTFSPRKVPGLTDQVGGLNMLQTDYDNDGCKDVLLLRGGWEAPQRKSLLRNNCDGTFTDVTAAVGLARPATSTQTAAWTDINNDGRLDLFVGNEDTTAQLFLNTGKGFEDISRAAGVDRPAGVDAGRIPYTKGVATGDFDNDGFQDLYVSNYDGTSFLYHNNHDNTFTDVARTAGAPGSGRGFATWFFDYDNDGWLDIFATSYFMSVDETARTYLGLPHNATTLKLYRNMRNGTFRDVTRDVGLDKVFMPMGSGFGDIDNDGFLDIYLGMGTPSYAAMAPHVLFRNDGGRSFVDVTAASGTGELHKGHGIAFVDLDSDGDEDIVAEIGGATPGDSHAMRVFENPGNGNDWIGLELVGTKTNRAAIGARVTVTVADAAGRTRSIHRAVGSGSSFGALALEQHVGLGRGARTVDVDVWWPVSNTRQHFGAVEKNQVIEITELAAAYRKIDRKAVRLGGAKRTN